MQTKQAQLRIVIFVRSSGAIEAKRPPIIAELEIGRLDVTKKLETIGLEPTTPALQTRCSPN
jgi:hypothetical protein